MVLYRIHSPLNGQCGHRGNTGVCVCVYVCVCVCVRDKNITDQQLHTLLYPSLTPSLPHPSLLILYFSLTPTPSPPHPLTPSPSSPEVGCKHFSIDTCTHQNDLYWTPYTDNLAEQDQQEVCIHISLVNLIHYNMTHACE